MAFGCRRITYSYATVLANEHPAFAELIYRRSGGHCGHGGQGLLRWVNVAAVRKGDHRRAPSRAMKIPPPAAADFHLGIGVGSRRAEPAFAT